MDRKALDEITDVDREMLNAVREDVVFHITSPMGRDTYEASDGRDLDVDRLSHLARLGLIAWRSTGIGMESRDRVELTPQGEEQAGQR